MNVQKISGFTLIEVLVAIALFSILIVVLSATLAGSLNLNRQSQQELSTTSGVQRIMESVRNAWGASDNYNNACAPNTALPSGYRVNFINLSTRAEPITQANVVANPASAAPSNTLNTTANSSCTASANATLASGGIPSMRRIVVVSGSGPQDVTLSFDFLGPRP